VGGDFAGSAEIFGQAAGGGNDPVAGNGGGIRINVEDIADRSGAADAQVFGNSPISSHFTFRDSFGELVNLMV